MRPKMIALVGRFDRYQTLLESTLRAADTQVVRFSGVADLIEGLVGDAVDLALVRLYDTRAKTILQATGLRDKGLAEKVVGIFSCGTDPVTLNGKGRRLDGILFEPYGYAELVGTVAEIIAPNDLLDGQERSRAK
jgi:hypothetical protein